MAKLIFVIRISPGLQQVYPFHQKAWSQQMTTKCFERGIDTFNRFFSFFFSGKIILVINYLYPVDPVLKRGSKFFSLRIGPK